MVVTRQADMGAARTEGAERAPRPGPGGQQAARVGHERLPMPKEALRGS
jgi:hypothetical protein